MPWSKKSLEWIEGNKAYISVPFTWYLPDTYSRCVWYRQQGYEVHAGGPAVSLIPDYLRDVAMVNGENIEALSRHNNQATRTSTGCIRACPFCAVRIIEGDLRELEIWAPKPIVCDNNLFACSTKHFDRVIDSLKPIPSVDFNQGLDVRLINSHHIDRLKELKLPLLRFSWDWMNEETIIVDTIKTLLANGFPKRRIRVYVLIGYNDSPADALYRLQTLKNLGIKTNPQRYQPLDILVKNSYVAPLWTNSELHRFMLYWSQQAWLSTIPFENFVD
jgi:hypothetical protein